MSTWTLSGWRGWAEREAGGSPKTPLSSDVYVPADPSPVHSPRTEPSSLSVAFEAPTARPLLGLSITLPIARMSFPFTLGAPLVLSITWSVQVTRRRYLGSTLKHLLRPLPDLTPCSYLV